MGAPGKGADGERLAGGRLSASVLKFEGRDGGFTQVFPQVSVGNWAAANDLLC